VLDIQDAEHEETAPDASRLVISKLACSLAGKRQSIHITSGTLTHQAYGKDEAIEEFRCNYGLNPRYREHFGKSELRIAAIDPDGEARIVELSNHPFFLATLFVPQLSSGPNMPHPLILAYLKAAHAFQTFHWRSEGQA
jgi:CTP synthase (UTP-ammonia lyase)